MTKNPSITVRDFGNVVVTTVVEGDARRVISETMGYTVDEAVTQLHVIQLKDIESKVTKTIIIDTCVGSCKHRPMYAEWNMIDSPIPALLKEANIDPDRVDIVLLTHLHQDHAGGGTEPDGNGGFRPTYKNARYRVEGVEVLFWRMETNPRLQALPDGDIKTTVSEVDRDTITPLLDIGVIDTFEGSIELAPGLYSIPTRGHTPGHTSFVLFTDACPIIFTGDVAHDMMKQLSNPTICPVGELDKDGSIQSRIGLLVLGADGSTHFLNAHDNFAVTAEPDPEHPDKWKVKRSDAYIVS